MILCCGESLIDMIPSKTSSGECCFVPRAGGAVLNTAVSLGRLGVPAGMLTGLSNDFFGQQLADYLFESKVDISHVIQSDRPTTLAFVHLQAGQATYSFMDENSAGRMLREIDLPVISSRVSALFLGGISLACEPSAETYAALLQREAKDRVVMLDPNIRPQFINDIDRYRARLTAMVKRSDIVKVSDDDLNWLMPEAIPLQEKAIAMLELGPSILIVTQGAEGVSAYSRDGSKLDVPASSATVVDTVGAGDTFNGGFLAKLSKLNCLSKTHIASLPNEVLKQALEFGASVAAVTVSREGANPPWAIELDN